MDLDFERERESEGIAFPNWLDFQKHRDYSIHFETWIKTVSVEWMQHFFEKGLLPFLKKYGYVVELSERHVKRLFYWAWSHSFVEASSSSYSYRVKHRETTHNGGAEEFDFFLYKISFEDWEMFYNSWSSFDFLDTSSVGHRQRSDFPAFVYGILNLEASVSHKEWLDWNTEEVSKEDEKDKDKENEYEKGYDGERRSY